MLRVSLLQILLILIGFAFILINSETSRKNKEKVELYDDDDDEIALHEFEKYDAEFNKRFHISDDDDDVDVDDDDDVDNDGADNDDGDEIYSDDYCLPPSTKIEAGISKVSISPVTQKPWNYMKDSYGKVKSQFTDHKFGTGDEVYPVITYAETSHNSTQTINATIEICYPDEKNMEINICPILAVKAMLTKGSDGGSVQIISGGLYRVIEKGEQFCVRVHVMNTISYNVVVGFYGITSKFLESRMYESVVKGELSKEIYDKRDKYLSSSSTYKSLAQKDEEVNK